jgi:hypothetical protein
MGTRHALWTVVGLLLAILFIVLLRWHGETAEPLAQLLWAQGRETLARVCALPYCAWGCPPAVMGLQRLPTAVKEDVIAVMDQRPTDFGLNFESAVCRPCPAQHVDPDTTGSGPGL